MTTQQTCRNRKKPPQETQNTRRSQDALDLYMELKFRRPDITQEQMANESGLSRSTVQRIAKGGPILLGFHGLFARYVAQYRPAVWPQSSNQMKELRARYQWFEKQSTEVFRGWLDSVEGLLQSSTHLQGNPTFDTVFALWLLAWIAHDRAYTLRQNTGANSNEALARYDRAVGHLEALVQDSSQPEDQELLARLKLARFVTFFNSRPAASRSQDPEVIGWLRQADIIASVKHLGDVAPHDWSLLRNGLIASCVLQDAASCKDFYSRLVHADSRFKELKYAPNKGKVPSIHDDPDCRFFVAYRINVDASSGCKQPSRQAVQSI